jgi:DNA primase
MENWRPAPGEAAQALRAAGIEVVKEHSGNGSEIRCRCSQHPDPDGHLYVNAMTGAAFCHRCGIRTHLAALSGERTGSVSPQDVLRQDVLAATAAYYHGALTEEARRYLTEERAIPPEIIERFGVGWADGGLRKHLLDEKGFPAEACVEAGVLARTEQGLRDFLYHRIVFPNVVGGRVVHLSGRALDEHVPKWLHLPGEISHPYNADALRHPDCLWVEGILDVLSAEAWGHRTAAGLGTHFKDSWVAHVPAENRVNVCLDGDRAGEEGRLRVARSLGGQARIVTLPSGKDPNDLLREGRRADFEGYLERAQDLLTHQVCQVPTGTPRVELPRVLSGVIEQIAAEEPPMAEAHLQVIKDRFRLSREEAAAYRRKVMDLRKAAEPGGTKGPAHAVEPSYTALFDGLVELVEQDGTVAFLVSEGGQLTVEVDLSRGDDRLLPPPRDQVPWLLPRAEEVLRWHEEDSDSDLYDALVAYHQGASELPGEAHYDLLAVWDMHTYLLEEVHYSPIICLYAVPERGKTRTGKAMIYVAYRGIHVESLRDAYIVRFAANLGGAIFFDVMHLWRKAEREGTEDVLLGRFERGIKVPRVLYPERGPHKDTVYYEIFGPTVIGTNEPVHHILDTRAVTITMPQARRNFEAEVTPEAARPLRERLAAFRARHLGKPLPELSKPAPGRLGDILKPLVQVVRMVRPEREGVVRELIGQLQRERLAEKAETLESEILHALDSIRDQVDGGTLPVKAVTEALNEGRSEKERVSPQLVGRRLRSLGFEKGQRTSAGTTIRWDEEKLVRAMEAYGLRETTHSAHSSQEGPTGAPEESGSEESVASDSSDSALAEQALDACEAGDAESAECAESAGGGVRPDAPTEPTGPCYTCGGRLFWRYEQGGWQCDTCHPPGDPARVAERIEIPVDVTRENSPPPWWQRTGADAKPGGEPT